MRSFLWGILFLGLTMTGGAWAETGREVLIHSNTLQMQESTGDIRFEGQVEVTMADAVLTCDLLTVAADEADPSRIVSGTASGNVVMVKGEDRIEARTASFDLEEGQAVLEGSPRLIRGETVIEAARIVYSIQEGTASFVGPVKASFRAPEEGP